MERLGVPEACQLDECDQERLLALRDVPWTEAIYYDGKTFSVRLSYYGGGGIYSLTINETSTLETVSFLYDARTRLSIGRYSDAQIAFIRAFLNGYQLVSRVDRHL